MTKPWLVKVGALFVKKEDASFWHTPAMQQYYLPTIYIIWRWTGISLAIIRSVSLRLQNEGQKNSRIAQMHTESLTRIFLTFSFFSMQRDFKRICKRDRLRLLRKWRMKNEEWRNEVRRPKGKPMKNEESTFGGRRESQLYNLEFIVQRKASAHALAKSV